MLLIFLFFYFLQSNMVSLIRFCGFFFFFRIQLKKIHSTSFRINAHMHAMVHRLSKDVEHAQAFKSVFASII